MSPLSTKGQAQRGHGNFRLTRTDLPEIGNVEENIFVHSINRDLVIISKKWLVYYSIVKMIRILKIDAGQIKNVSALSNTRLNF